MSDILPPNWQDLIEIAERKRREDIAGKLHLGCKTCGEEFVTMMDYVGHKCKCPALITWRTYDRLLQRV